MADKDTTFAKVKKTSIYSSISAPIKSELTPIQSFSKLYEWYPTVFIPFYRSLSTQLQRVIADPSKHLLLYANDLAFDIILDVKGDGESVYKAGVSKKASANDDTKEEKQQYSKLIEEIKLVLKTKLVEKGSINLGGGQGGSMSLLLDQEDVKDLDVSAYGFTNLQALEYQRAQPIVKIVLDELNRRSAEITSHLYGAFKNIQVPLGVKVQDIFSRAGTHPGQFWYDLCKYLFMPHSSLTMAKVHTNYLGISPMLLQTYRSYVQSSYMAEGYEKDQSKLDYIKKLEWHQYAFQQLGLELSDQAIQMKFLGEQFIRNDAPFMQLFVVYQTSNQAIENVQQHLATLLLSASSISSSSVRSTTALTSTIAGQSLYKIVQQVEQELAVVQQVPTVNQPVPTIIQPTPTVVSPKVSTEALYANPGKGKAKNMNDRKQADQTLDDQQKHPPFICQCCGGKNHKSSECDFNRDICGICEERGHLSIVCYDNPNNNDTSSAQTSNGAIAGKIIFFK
jgi:hypothetical protein